VGLTRRHDPCVPQDALFDLLGIPVAKEKIAGRLRSTDQIVGSLHDPSSPSVTPIATPPVVSAHIRIGIPFCRGFRSFRIELVVMPMNRDSLDLAIGERGPRG
jgi:hypothetical protein